jgi:hypothetical protein
MDYHLLVYDNSQNTENTDFLFALQVPLFSHSGIFSCALELENANTVEFHFVSGINNSIS